MNVVVGNDNNVTGSGNYLNGSYNNVEGIGLSVTGSNKKIPVNLKTPNSTVNAQITAKPSYPPLATKARKRI